MLKKMLERNGKKRQATGIYMVDADAMERQREGE
jgi:hypothetical protein